MHSSGSDPDNRILGQPQDSFFARYWSAACDVPLEEKHVVNMINGLLEKKTTTQNSVRSLMCIISASFSICF